MDGRSLVDFSKDLLFLEAILEILLTCEVTLGTMTMFVMLELLKSWKFEVICFQLIWNASRPLLNRPSFHDMYCGFDGKPLKQIGLYSGYTELGIFYWTLVGSVSILWNLLNPGFLVGFLHSTPLLGTR